MVEWEVPQKEGKALQEEEILHLEETPLKEETHQADNPPQTPTSPKRGK